MYDQAPGTWDVLLGDRGPSCYLTEQVANKKVYVIRFLGSGAAKEGIRYQKEAFCSYSSQLQWQCEICRHGSVASDSRKDQIDYQLPQHLLNQLALLI